MVVIGEGKRRKEDEEKDDHERGTRPNSCWTLDGSVGVQKSLSSAPPHYGWKHRRWPTAQVDGLHYVGNETGLLLFEQQGVL